MLLIVLLIYFASLVYTQMRGHVLSSTVPAHRMCHTLLMVSYFASLVYTQMRGQVLSSTAPAHRMCHTLLIVLYFASLVFTQMRGQVISSTVPAHRTSYRLLIVVTFWDAVPYPHECSSALKYRACAQNVSDVIHIVYILGCWPTPR